MPIHCNNLQFLCCCKFFAKKQNQSQNPEVIIIRKLTPQPLHEEKNKNLTNEVTIATEPVRNNRMDNGPVCTHIY